jgi:hypothetical protein
LLRLPLEVNESLVHHIGFLLVCQIHQSVQRIQSFLGIMPRIRKICRRSHRGQGDELQQFIASKRIQAKQPSD